MRNSLHNFSPPCLRCLIIVGIAAIVEYLVVLTFKRSISRFVLVTASRDEVFCIVQSLFYNYNSKSPQVEDEIHLCLIRQLRSRRQNWMFYTMIYFAMWHLFFEIWHYSYYYTTSFFSHARKSLHQAGLAWEKPVLQTFNGFCTGSSSYVWEVARPYR